MIRLLERLIYGQNYFKQGDRVEFHKGGFGTIVEAQKRGKHRTGTIRWDEKGTNGHKKKPYDSISIPMYDKGNKFNPVIRRLPSVRFKLGDRHYDWYDFGRVDRYTFESKDGSLVLHCNTDVHEDYDGSYVVLDGKRTSPRRVGMSLYDIWSLVHELDQIFRERYQDDQI